MKILIKKNKVNIANQYNSATINFISDNKADVKKSLIDVINKKDKTYSPLALYFLIDNNIIKNNKTINKLFDIIINDINLQKEIKNLLIYKKAVFNSEFVSENELIKMLSPIINSDSIWKSHSLFLLGEYFYSKNEKQKAKEFFNQILILKDSNSNIMISTQNRLNRDFSD